MPETKLRPILFNTEMVRAILDGRKTVTRRVIKQQPLMKLCYTFAGHDCRKWGYPGKNDYKYWGDEYKFTCEIPEQEQNRKWTPPCHGDDILYVRETFRVRTNGGDLSKGTRWAEIEYKAGGENLTLAELPAEAESWMRSKWIPSIHMPKEATRIFLKVKTVSVERLQDIDDDGVVAEGLEIGAPFDELWDSTIKPKDRDLYGWDANPWVWVIEFERVEKPEGGAENDHRTTEKNPLAEPSVSCREESKGVACEAGA